MISAQSKRRSGAATRFILYFFLLYLPISTLDAQETLVRHSLSFEHRNKQYVRVTMQRSVNQPQIEVAMPSWTPGSYVIRDFAANVERLTASDQNGRDLSVEKVAKNRWRINSEGSRELTLSYDVWAGQLHVSSSWVESRFALLNGAGLFLYSADSLDWPQEVVVNMPGPWRDIHTSLTAVPGDNRFRAQDYDELVDSPIVAGNSEAYPFEQDGQEYVLVNMGESGFWDGERAVEDLAALVGTQQDFWGVNPFDRPYLFLNFMLDFKAGLEHDHSTVMLGGRWVMRNRNDYIKWLSLVSHEFFHAWNVRRMRPEALANYDYDAEVYTHELWLAEGISSYYDNLLLFRSGLVDVSEYLELLAREFRNYETIPGREVRSAELASMDSWIKHYVPDANSVNSTVSYYLRGALIGFVTDATIRRETDNKASLDTVMRRMYELYGPGGPGQGIYPPGAFEDVVESIAGPKLRPMLNRLLRSANDPDIDEALDWYGLQLDRAPLRNIEVLDGEPAPAGFGVTWKTGDQLLTVEQVIHGGAAAEAGVIPGDELLAINGLRIFPLTFVHRTARLHPGEEVELTLARNGQLLEMPLIVGHAIAEKYVISLKEGISRREKNRMEKWLGSKLKFAR